MRTTGLSSRGSTLVTDASVGVWAVLPQWAPVDVSQHFARWYAQAVRLQAPELWAAEAVSAIRSYVHVRQLTAQEAELAVEDLFALEIELLPMTPDLCRAALGWAERLRQRRAYDVFYLALAEMRGAEFWTADQRLANAARQAGATWTRWIGEPTVD